MGLSLSTASSNVQVSNHISDEVCNYVSDDITFSILSKLPLKSLKRFECACKSCSLLFDNPYFMTMHHNYLLILIGMFGLILIKLVMIKLKMTIRCFGGLIVLQKLTRMCHCQMFLFERYIA